jgi:hypothetical protein
VIYVTEKELQSMIVQAANHLGWLVYHTYDSRRSPEGFPDLLLVKDDVCLVYECKTEKGRLGPMQQAWIDAFNTAGIPARIVRPADLDDVLNELRGAA